VLVAQFRRLDNVVIDRWLRDALPPKEERGTTEDDCACGDADNLFH
jgi:hypothetical protein